MSHRTLLYLLAATLLPAADPTLAKHRPGAHTRWSSFENPTAGKGAGGAENRGAKGHAFDAIDTLALDKPDPDALYFHASWRRERWTTLGRDFELLPHVQGEGRFLGVHVGVITHPDNTGWWGEGEVKMFVDGDKDLPTIIGTGTEDYIGTGWGQGVYHQRYQGSLVSDAKAGQYAFYRYHIPDAVYFHKELRVTMQQIGGDPKNKMTAMQKRGVAMRPVSIEHGGKFTKLAESGETVQLESLKAPDDAWVNAYRRDDWSAVALFYLDKPENGLPALAPVAQRTEALK